MSPAGSARGVCTCETCRFSIELPDETTPRTMQCRRYPPQLVVKDDEWGLWPRTLADHWCGEWRKAPGLTRGAKHG